MVPPNIRVPDRVFSITSLGHGLTTFMTKTEEWIRLDREDRKAKLEICTVRRGEPESSFHRVLRKCDGTVTKGYFVIMKLP
jgi:hypothetical protein